MTPKQESLSFRPSARLLFLLGDQLIKNAGIAVLELVKNAYDADASRVKISLLDVQNPDGGSVKVEDDGCGMDLDVITKVWLVPGTDYRAQQRTQGIRTPKFKRLPLGEKGIGRFAAHKLGNLVKVISKKEGSPEVVVKVDWEQFAVSDFLDQIPISVTERSPRYFDEGNTGTLVEVTSLRDAGEWTRGSVRRLHRAIMSMCSPFDSPHDFKTIFVMKPDYGWLEELLTTEKVLEFALYEAHCTVEGTKLWYKYEFHPPSGMRLVSERKERKGPMEIYFESEKGEQPSETKEFDIGPVSVNLYIYDLDTAILALTTTDIKGLKDFLRNNGGVRVYRDGIRVYDYGEPENDWLNLGEERVNQPARRLSNNIVVGAVSLDSEGSRVLIEKTNREGFVENRTYRLFRDAVRYAVRQVEAERNLDKERIRTAYNKANIRVPVTDEIQALKKELERRNLIGELGPLLVRIDEAYSEMRDRLLTAAGSGLSLLMVIHEVEKGVLELKKAASRKASNREIQELVEHLADLIEGLGSLARKSRRRQEKASSLIQQALFNSSYRLDYHGIEVLNGIDLGEDPDFTVKCSRRLVIATLMNLIDNSIWWLENKGAKKKQIYIGTSLMLKGGPAIVVADNGPGFIDPPEYLAQPFFSRKPDGMGLGLYIAKQVMEAHDGRLVFPNTSDLELYKGVDKAVVALVFEGEE